tara:strand:+ start:300 stop:1028 length:729 start_codon:yes stop_codon:yes gene_type:complete
MGFEIHPAEKPYYQATFTVWEWSRFLDLLLYSAGAINMEQMLNNIIHVSMMEAKALNHGNSEEEIANFDVTEYKKNVEVVKKADRSKMEIIDEDMPDGSKKFVGATVMMKEGTPDEAVESMVEMVAVSIAVFQHMEDKLFAAREKVPCFRAFGRNGQEVKGDDIWAIYDCMMNFFGGDVPDMLRMTSFPNKKRVIPKFSNKDSKAFHEFIKENVQPHDIGNWPRMMGVLGQTIEDGDYLIIS